MKPPDLTVVDNAGVHSWSGPIDPLRAAATNAHLRFATIDLAKAKDRATLFAELDSALKLPEHFGHNFDALADVFEDRDWLGRHGIVLALAHATTCCGCSPLGVSTATASTSFRAKKSSMS